ncbi:MAG: hypothetical protein ACTSWJ_08700 [Candidatus Heimdallarchaeaceae archaeon]
MITALTLVGHQAIGGFLDCSPPTRGTQHIIYSTSGFLLIERLDVITG